MVFRLGSRLLRLLYIALGLVVILATLLSCLPEPVPDEGTISYTGPIELSVAPGSEIPGTDLGYVGISDDMAEFTIDDKRALKKIGDSLDWKGDPLGGIHLELNLRVLLITEQVVHTGGKVALQIDGVTPEAADVGAPDATKFTVPVTYGVELGETIPGTLITYEGRDADKGALLGIQDYPYRKVGDSIVWEGRLRNDTMLKLDLRVLYFTDGSLHVGGLASVFLSR